MTALYVIITLLVILIGFLLWTPIIIKVDTDTNDYFVQWRGLAKARIEGDEQEIVRVKLNVLFLNFKFYPLRSWGKSEKKKGHSEVKKTKKFNPKNGRIALRVLRTFEIKQFLLHLDTGDYILNAKLYPVFFFLNRFYGDFAINFNDKNRLALQVQNRPIFILKSFINN
jgi:hypothetical protein